MEEGYAAAARTDRVLEELSKPADKVSRAAGQSYTIVTLHKVVKQALYPFIDDYYCLLYMFPCRAMFGAVLAVAAVFAVAARAAGYTQVIVHRAEPCMGGYPS